MSTKGKWQKQDLLFSLTHLNKGLPELVIQASMILVKTGQSWDGDGIRGGTGLSPKNDQHRNFKIEYAMGWSQASVAFKGLSREHIKIFISV